ncbi:MAG: hypothetical protein KJ930_07370 [Gammaproteobacteria bacterium]|jgi:hypothetical protein|nr:hypothetical protein [Gammaproteobacteria bacterium]MBU2222769.1 hypothetical protein [Gammaproteobacteria bacterium]MBU2277525.1 hypothetical protein [Gammaproteobacteria bacterium]MBU2427203.1 hypothetical protein [Gammaproteobacteria bacterium]
MAIISCPYCRKQVSDKAAACMHCSAQLGEISAEELQKLQREKKQKMGDSLNNHAMLAMLIFLSSFIWYYYRTPEPDSLELNFVYGTMLLGCAWYMITKVRIVLNKRK